MSEVKVTINGKAVTAQAGQTVLEAAQAAGIDIPVLCQHPALSNWGACRMCLVEVEGMRGYQTACTCPVTDEMEVTTESDELADMRRFILELLFSERNHYCMYCQMSGDCELQSMAYRYGLDHWTYPRPYERMEVDASRKYFIMDPNRCILCSRCVRACSEIPANHTLNLRDRGADTRIVADLDVPFGESTCISCGTCLQVCPTGALIDARSAYGGREQDVVHVETTCMQCSVGCALDVVTRYERMLRVDGVWDSEPSGGLLCVRGRFEPLYDERKRLTKPMIRKNGELVEANWDEALDLVAEKMKRGKSFGLTGSATTNEALQAFSKLFAKAGKAGRMEAEVPELGYGEPAKIGDVLTSDYIVIAGADPLSYQPVIGYFIRRRLDQDVPLAIVGESENELADRADLVVGYDAVGKVVEAASEAENPVVLYSVGLKSEAIAGLKPLADKARFLALIPGRNTMGAAAAGLAPLAPEDADLVYVLLGEQTEDEALLAMLDGAFTVVQASYKTPLVERADVVLPTPIWAERTGHVTNLEGRVLDVQPSIEAPEGVREETEVFASLEKRLS